MMPAQAPTGTNEIQPLRSAQAATALYSLEFLHSDPQSAHHIRVQCAAVEYVEECVCIM